MGSLKVFDSQGRAMYPASASDENQMQRYFDQDILAVGPKNDKFKIEAYLKVKTSERNEQVSIRYIGDNLDTLYADCRAAIRSQLVEKRGWTIREPYGNGPGKLPWLAIWEGIEESNTNKTPEDLYVDSEFGLGLNREDSSLLESVVHEENEPVRITASDYEVIARALLRYLTTGETIVVSRERHSPPEYTDIHLSVSSDQWEDFRLHDETRATLERLKEQRREELRQERLSDLSETIASLKKLNADKSAVKNQLSTALSDSYTGLRVMENSEIRELQQRASTEKLDHGQSTASESRLLAGLRARPKLRMVPILLVVIVVGALFLTGFVGLPFSGGDGGSDDPDGSIASFNITDVDHSEAVVDENINISVAVANEGAGSGNGTVSLEWDDSEYTNETNLDEDEEDIITFDVDTVDQPGNYTYYVEVDDDSEEGKIRVYSDSNDTVSDSIVDSNLPRSVNSQTAKSSPRDGKQTRKLTSERFSNWVTINIES